MINKMHDEVNHNLVATARNNHDSAREKKIENDIAKERGNNMYREIPKIDKTKAFNKKGDNDACKCVLF